MSFSLLDIWNHMGFTARTVNLIMVIMSIYSLSVMIERYMTFFKAKKQSRSYAPKVAKLLKDSKIQDVIRISKNEDVKNSHLAKVLLPALEEYQSQQENGTRSHDEMMESAHRAIERATALNLTDLRRGLAGLGTVGATAPFVGLFGTVAGIINAFRGMALTGSGGIGAVSAGIAEALIATAVGLGVAIPAVWAFNYLTTRIEGFTVEMDNSASELMDYMAKKAVN